MLMRASPKRTLSLHRRRTLEEDLPKPLRELSPGPSVVSKLQVNGRPGAKLLTESEPGNAARPTSDVLGSFVVGGLDN
jgi:hypothetical protein